MIREIRKPEGPEWIWTLKKYNNFDAYEMFDCTPFNWYYFLCFFVMSNRVAKSWD